MAENDKPFIGESPKKRQGSFLSDDAPPRVEIVECEWRVVRPEPRPPLPPVPEPEPQQEEKFAFEEETGELSEQAKALQRFFDDERKRRAA